MFSLQRLLSSSQLLSMSLFAAFGVSALQSQTPGVVLSQINFVMPNPMSASESSSLSAADAMAPAMAPVPAIMAGVTLPPTKSDKTDKHVRPFSKFAIGTKPSSLGIGGQIATPLSRSVNLRGGGDFLSLNQGLTYNGWNVTGDVHFHNAQASLDWFPFHGKFRISPGVVIFKGRIMASVVIPGGNSFDMGDATYTSSVSDPVTGSAVIALGRSVMPALTMGFGNMITQKNKHWSMPFEIGAAYSGTDSIALQMKGTACSSSGCSGASDPTFQQNVSQQQGNINEMMKRLQIYPILTTGLAYRF